MKFEMTNEESANCHELLRTMLTPNPLPEAYRKSNPPKDNNKSDTMRSKVNSRTKLNWHIEANRKKTGKKQRIKRKLAQTNCDKGRQLVDGRTDLDRQLQLKRDTVKSSKMRQTVP